jgi:hypothetical protein
MEKWSSLSARERRESILRATGEHDYGWGVHDAEPTLDAEGRIQDFMHLPLSMRQGVWPRSVAQLASDPWAAALVAHHAIFVYDRFRSDPAWQDFFIRMEALRAEMLAQSSRLTQRDLEDDYVYVRLGDLASLTFCCGWADPQHFADYTMRLNDARLVITPDPFNGRELPIEVTAREVPQRQFTTDGDARAALQRARTIKWSGTALGRDSA